MSDDRIKGRDAIVGEEEFELGDEGSTDLEVGGVTPTMDGQLPVTTERDLDLDAAGAAPTPPAPTPPAQAPVAPVPPTAPQLPIVPRPRQATGPQQPLPPPGTAPLLPVVSPLPPEFQRPRTPSSPTAPQPGYPPRPQAPPPQAPPPQSPQGYPPPQPGYPPGQPPQQPGYPPQQPGYPPQQPGYPPQPQAPQAPQAPYPPQQPTYPPGPPQPGYPPQPQHTQPPPGYPPQAPQQPGYPPQQPGYPPGQPQPGYPPQPQQTQPPPGYPPAQPGHPPGPQAPPVQPHQQPEPPEAPPAPSGQDYGLIGMEPTAPPEVPVSRGGAAEPAIGQDYGNLDLGGDDDAPLEESVETDLQPDTAEPMVGSLYADLAPADADGDLELDAVVERVSDAAGTVFEGPADLSGLSSKSTGNHPAVLDAQLALPTPPPDEGLPQMAPVLPAQGEAPGRAGLGSAKQLAAAELFKQIAKAVKTLNLYEGRGDSCGQAVDLAFRTAKEVLSEHSNLLLKVTPYEFLLEGAAVYTSKEDRRGMTYRLFRDGVRELELLPQLERDEFAELLEILRRVQPASGEDDTVTQLWERNLKGLRYKAIDFFLEGMVVAESDDVQAQIDALAEVATRPLHGMQQITVGQEVRAQLTKELLEQAAAKRQQRLAAVQGPGADLEARMVALADEVARMPDDLWRRTSAIILRLMELGRGASTVGLLVQLIEQMMLEGRWQMLAVACRSLGEVIEKVGGAGGKSKAAQVLQANLGRLCTDNKLLELEGLLAVSTVSQFNLLAELLRILPPDANPQLIQLLSKTPQGEVQDKFVGVLRDRRVDLTDHYKDRLRSPNIMHVIYAVHDLRAVNLPRALEAIATAADHPSPRVRLEVFRALGDKIDETLLPHLISSLTQDHRELREMAFNLLARIRVPKLVPRLIQITKQEIYEEWSPTHREHLLGLIVRWGGPESNDFVIRGITAKNPLRRKKIDALREELIAALRRLGGGRSRKLLQACLDARPSRAVKQSLSEALEVVEAKAKAQRGKK